MTLRPLRLWVLAAACVAQGVGCRAPEIILVEDLRTVQPDGTAPVDGGAAADGAAPVDAAGAVDAVVRMDSSAAVMDQTVAGDLAGPPADLLLADLAVVVDAPLDTATPPVDLPAVDATMVDASLLPVPDGGATIVPGAADRFLLIGTIVTPGQVIEGQVLVESGLITCVAAGVQCAAMPGAIGATVVDTAGVISPGLIDAHNHILFDIFDEADWIPAKLYQNHDEWPAEANYQRMLDVKQCLVNDSQGKPAWCPNTPYGTPTGTLRCEIDKFGELKSLVAGVTSIVGLPGTTAACFGSLARSIDAPQSGLPTDKIQTSSLFPPSTSAADAVCANYASDKTDSYLIHCGEGIDAKSLAEFQKLNTVTTVDGCLLAKETVITHGTSFGPTEFAIMGQSGMKLTWSGASNFALYGQTADIPAALAAGVSVSLGADWSMGGSQNLVEEMRFDDAWDDSHWGDQLKARDLLLMATENGAKALAVDQQLGRLAVGMTADIAVFAGDRSKPYDSILAARPKDVTLVMVGGVVLYGDLALKAAGPALPGCETINICGTQKFLCVATTTTTSKLDQTYAQIKAILEQAMLDVDVQTPNDMGLSFAPLTPLVKCR